jgi:hypothetical protein
LLTKSHIAPNFYLRFFGFFQRLMTRVTFYLCP